MSTEPRVKATFAGSVAVLWLDHLHGLIMYVQAGNYEDALLDRIERLLMHLENSSMPIPGMTIEDVLQVGADIAAGEATKAKEEDAAGWAEQEAIETYVNSKVEVTERIAAERDLDICVDCRAPMGGPTHAEMCGDVEAATERARDVRSDDPATTVIEKASAPILAVEQSEGEGELGNNQNGIRKSPLQTYEINSTTPKGSAAGNAAERRRRAKDLGLDPTATCPDCHFTYGSAAHLDNCQSPARVPALIAESAAVEASDCIHHWKIDPAKDGLEMTGATCRKCFSRREFRVGEPFKLPTKGTPWSGVKKPEAETMEVQHGSK